MSQKKKWMRNPGVTQLAFTKERKDQYCEELRLHGEMPLARQVVGIASQTIYNHRAKDPEFKQAELDAMEWYRCHVHKEVHRRGISGWDEPVYHNGVVVGYKRRFSDPLLLAHAKRHSPELYGDKLKVDQTTHLEGELSLDLEKLSPESRELLRRILEIEAQKDEGS